MHPATCMFSLLTLEHYITTAWHMSSKLGLLCPSRRPPRLVRAKTLAISECRIYEKQLNEKQKQRSRVTQQTEEHLRGELMCVCGDCKAMVLHILASIKVRREQQTAASTPHESPRHHHLHLNLNPVYH
ncbi:hypothetical protein GWK47_008169 [Chionoecetes opilio]|uniref:Uncharacterized protein n=1 Tax=Chionoecetes opilio TaxID=41210 RepID=A0A8J4Y5R0_CHIOP|nr:hypothetical protein GWK47_008169 [Chionoecetes opilio]